MVMGLVGGDFWAVVARPNAVRRPGRAEGVKGWSGLVNPDLEPFEGALLRGR